MTKERRVYSAEFRLKAVRLVTEQGYTTRQVGDALDVFETIIRRWVKKYRDEHGVINVPNDNPLTPDQQRIKELEAQVKLLEREKAILKKASALLLADEIKHTL